MPEVSIVPKFESNGDGSDSQNVFAHGIAARDLRRARQRIIKFPKRFCLTPQPWIILWRRPRVD
jgi:hypothetical protein